MINLASKINPQRLDNFNVKISRITGRCQVIRTLMDMEYFLCKKKRNLGLYVIYFFIVIGYIKSTTILVFIVIGTEGVYILGWPRKYKCRTRCNC